jgi:TolB-like protein
MRVQAALCAVAAWTYLLLGAWQGNAQTVVPVAVLEFQNASGVPGMEPLCTLVPEMLKTELSRSLAIKVLERTALEGVLQELALAQSGLLNEQEAVTVGQMAGARYVIQGTISRSGRALRLDAHIVEVNTGTVVGEKVEGRDGSALPQMVGLLARNIIYDLTGEGQRRQQVRVRTYPVSFALGGTLVCGIAALVTHLNYRDAHDEYQRATRLADFDRTYERANNYLKARNVLLGVTGVGAAVTISLLGADKAGSNYVVAAAQPPQESKVVLQPVWDDEGLQLGLSVRW